MNSETSRIVSAAVAATLLAVGIAAAGYAVGGRYEFEANSSGLLRYGRFTGEGTICAAPQGVPLCSVVHPARPWLVVEERASDK